jgi:hypothetical protein
MTRYKAEAVLAVPFAAASNTSYAQGVAPLGQEVAEAFARPATR